MVRVDKDDARELIQVKLEEYRRLSGEISTRLAGLASLLGFLTAGLAFVVGARATGKVSIGYLAVAVGVAAVIGVGYWVYQIRRLDYIASGLLAVEDEINDLAYYAYPTACANNGLFALAWQTTFCKRLNRRFDEVTSKPHGLANVLQWCGIPTGWGSLAAKRGPTAYRLGRGPVLSRPQ